MSVPMSLLAMLDERPMYGLELRNEFEARTGGVWPLNVGQVYTTLGRLERDGLVTLIDEQGGNKTYRITEAGRSQLASWFARPDRTPAPARDELVLKLLMALSRPTPDVLAVIQAERRVHLERLQEFTRLKADAAGPDDLGWLLLLDSLIFKAEAGVRWLDACEARIARHPQSSPTAERAPASHPIQETTP